MARAHGCLLPPCALGLPCSTLVRLKVKRKKKLSFLPRASGALQPPSACRVPNAIGQQRSRAPNTHGIVTCAPLWERERESPPCATCNSISSYIYSFIYINTICVCSAYTLCCAQMIYTARFTSKLLYITLNWSIVSPTIYIYIYARGQVVGRSYWNYKCTFLGGGGESFYSARNNGHI